MSKLSRDDILKLAALSRLKLTEQEIKEFQAELSAVLDYVEILNKTDVAGLGPTFQVTGLKNVMRGDNPHEYEATAEKVLALAPKSKDHQYKVRRILD